MDNTLKYPKARRKKKGEGSFRVCGLRPQLHLNDLEDSDNYDSTGYCVSVSTGGSESLGENQKCRISVLKSYID